MSNQAETGLYQAAEQTFEQIAFMFLLPESEQEAGNAKQAHEATAIVGYTGPFSGKLIVRSFGKLLPAIAANMLGEENTPPEQQLDAWGEIANIICGNVLPGIAGMREVFHLQAPQVTRQEVTCNTERAVAQVRLYMDEGCAELVLYADTALN